MIKEIKNYFAPLLFLVDLSAVLIVYVVLALLASKGIISAGAFSIPAPYPDAPWIPPGGYAFAHFILFLLPPVALLGFDRVCPRTDRHPLATLAIPPCLAIIMTAAVYMPLVQIRPPDVSGGQVPPTGLCLILFFVFFSFNRWSLFQFVKHCGKQSNVAKNYLVLGTGRKAIAFSRAVDNHPQWGIRIDGFIAGDTQKAGRTIGSHPVVGSVDNLAEILKTRVADGILYARDREHLPHIDTVFRRCQTEGIDFAFVSGGRPPRNAAMEKIGGFAIISLKTIIQHPVKLFIKRFFDFAAATTLICVLLPFWITIPILIARDSAGPIFFRQERIGKNGRRFIMYKFRSMVDQAEKLQTELSHLNEMDGPAFKIKEDPRQTRVGRILRRTSLDELPQLFNVFKGDISLVGPRPPIRREVAQYHPWEKKRLSVIPGITCLWQVSGRNNIKFDEWMKLDLMYIENWSFALDLKILIETIPAVISRKGAR